MARGTTSRRAAHPAPSLAPFAHVDLSRLLRGLGVGSSSEWDERLRLTRLLEFVEGVPPADFASESDLEAVGREEAEDRLLERMRAIDIAPFALPAFAVVQRCDSVPSAQGLVTDPVLALALVSRVSGSVFVAHRSPRPGPLLERGTSFRFFAAPATSPGKGEVRP